MVLLQRGELSLPLLVGLAGLGLDAALARSLLLFGGAAATARSCGGTILLLVVISGTLAIGRTLQSHDVDLALGREAGGISKVIEAPEKILRTDKVVVVGNVLLGVGVREEDGPGLLAGRRGGPDGEELARGWLRGCHGGGFGCGSGIGRGSIGVHGHGIPEGRSVEVVTVHVDGAVVELVGKGSWLVSKKVVVLPTVGGMCVSKRIGCR